MNYQVLKQPRYSLTKEEAAENKTLITITVYDNILEYRTKKDEGKKNIPQTIILERNYSPFFGWNLPMDEEILNRDIVKKLEDIELAHQVASLYRMGQPFQGMMDEIRTDLLKTSYATIDKERYLLFIKNILIPLIPSLKGKPIPLILPIRQQKGNKEKRDDKYRFYFKVIKKIQLFYENEQVIYLEGSDDSRFGLLVIFPKGEKPFGPLQLIPSEHARSIDDYRKHLNTVSYQLS